MASTDHNNQFANQAEGAIKRMGLEGYTPYKVKPLNLPERIESAEVAEIINASIAEGNDPAADPEVQHVIARRGIMEYTGWIRTQQENDESVLRVQMVKKQAPALIEEMKAKFEAATDELREAYKVLGAERLWDEKASWPPHDPKWPTRVKARAAIYTTDTIISNWSYLMQTIYGQIGINAGVRVFAIPTAANYEIHRNELASGKRSDWSTTGVYDMLIMGVEVDLATTYAEVHERVQTLDAVLNARRELR
ncbi:hypothetical protein [Paeniglutamicibacter sp.]|uniref:hypothetical protein n=1 Tax=Paeniglutamicibacter sp. TaxID=1934391 RepID=UPI00398A37C1